jgi:transposase-like protein
LPALRHGRSGWRLNGVKDKKTRVRIGLWKCYSCRKQFAVKVGTVFEAAHIPLHKMLQAVHLMCSSKKGISAHQRGFWHTVFAKQCGWAN